MAPLSVFSVFLWAAFASASGPGIATPSEYPVPGRVTSQGCFKSLPHDAVESKTDVVFLTSGACADACKGSLVSITSPTKCLCSNLYPPRNDRVADKDCDAPCPGFVEEGCGSLSGDYSVFNLGDSLNVKFDSGSGSSKSDDDDDDADSDDTDESEEKMDSTTRNGILAIASGAWSKSEGAVSNIMSNVCAYIDCTSKKGSSQKHG